MPYGLEFSRIQFGCARPNIPTFNDLGAFGLDSFGLRVRSVHEEVEAMADGTTQKQTRNNQTYCLSSLIDLDLFALQHFELVMAFNKSVIRSVL